MNFSMMLEDGNIENGRHRFLVDDPETGMVNRYHSRGYISRERYQQRFTFKGLLHRLELCCLLTDSKSCSFTLKRSFKPN